MQAELQGCKKETASSWLNGWFSLEEGTVVDSDSQRLVDGKQGGVQQGCQKADALDWAASWLGDEGQAREQGSRCPGGIIGG